MQNNTLNKNAESSPKSENVSIIQIIFFLKFYPHRKSLNRLSTLAVDESLKK